MSDSYAPEIFDDEDDWGEEIWEDGEWVTCKACYGTGIDPASMKSGFSDDEYDCLQCQGYGEVEIRS